MKKFLVSAVVALALVLGAISSLSAHCEIPCGIYEDSTRFYLISEDIATIEKSMDQIVTLSAAGDKNYNQIVRWVVNKEEHADKLMEIVTQYFMTQRIAPAATPAPASTRRAAPACRPVTWRLQLAPPASTAPTAPAFPTAST